MIKGKFVMEKAYSGGFEFMLPTGSVQRQIVLRIRKWI
jgi:hypothetical protein